MKYFPLIWAALRRKPVRTIITFLSVTMAFTLMVRAQDAPGPLVDVTGGKIAGRRLAAGAVFKAIPFAQAPVGELRWREPQPVRSWSGLRQAAEFGNSCVQANANWNKLAFEHGSEDCLFLNVWTPQWPAGAKKPVMVWIHGGGNTGGSAMGAGSTEPPFDGASLARHGVVVVTINYRLGLFGFMGHPALTAESPHHASGGYGLLDQVAALQWVHDNIARFGGDPGNVTVFGQSAGAQDLTILIASPLARGLIHKAIVQSGSPMISDRRLQTPAQTEQLGVILAAALKAPAGGELRYLRALPAAQILDALLEVRKVLAEQKLILDVGMDGYAAAKFPAEIYRAGLEARIPMIIGNNGRDATGYRPAGTTQEEINAAVKKNIEEMYGSYPDLNARALAAYGVDGTPAGADYAPYGPLDQQFAVDHAFRCQAVAETGWHSRIAPAYEYEFDAGTPAHPPTHSAELFFVFGDLGERTADPMLVKLSDQMQAYWTNFAKSGNPNGPGLPQWPRFDAAARRYVEFGNSGSAAKASLRNATCPIYVEKLTRDLVARKER